MSIKRITTITQDLNIKVDLGELPEAKRLPTVYLRRKIDGALVKANQSDYGKERMFLPRDYTELTDYDPDIGIDRDRSPPKIYDSLYTADDLAAMPVRDIRKLPEFSRVTEDERKALKSKQDYVDIILGKRSTSVSMKSQREVI